MPDDEVKQTRLIMTDDLIYHIAINRVYLRHGYSRRKTRMCLGTLGEASQLCYYWPDLHRQVKRIMAEYIRIITEPLQVKP